MKIYFVRHGQSVANIGELEQGPEEPLSDLGRRQAAFVGKRLQDIAVTRILSSPYERTKETAQIIASEIAKPLSFSELFVERRPPTELIGKPGDGPETQAARLIWERERKTNPSFRYSDEETFTEIKDRARDALAFLIAEQADHAVVVTHGGFLKVLASYMVFGESLSYVTYLDMHNALKTKNTGITLVEYKDDPNPFHGGWNILAWNDYAHL